MASFRYADDFFQNTASDEQPAAPANDPEAHSILEQWLAVARASIRCDRARDGGHGYDAEGDLPRPQFKPTQFGGRYIHDLEEK